MIRDVNRMKSALQRRRVAVVTVLILVLMVRLVLVQQSAWLNSIEQFVHVLKELREILLSIVIKLVSRDNLQCKY